MTDLVKLLNDVLDTPNLKKINEFKAALLVQKSFGQNFISHTKVLLSKKLITHQLLEFIYEALSQLQAHQEIYELTNDINFENRYVFQKLCYLNALYGMGKIEDFFDELEKLHEQLIVQKLYAKYSQFEKQFQKSLDNKSYYLVGRIIVNLEAGNYDQASVYLEKARAEFLNGHKKINLIEAIYNTVEQYEGDYVSLYKQKLYLKAILAIEANYELLTKEIVELILFAQDRVEYLITLHLLKRTSTREKLFRFVEKMYPIKLNEAEPFFKDLVKELKGNVEITRIPYEENTDTEEIFQYPYTTDVSEEVNIVSIGIPKYTPSEVELNTLTYFKYSDDGDVANYDLVVALMNMGMFKVAKFLLDKLDDSSNKMYLLAIISLNMNEYAEAIYLANKCILDYGLKDDEVIPFEKIKYEVFKELGDVGSLESCLANITRFDPGFGKTRT